MLHALPARSLRFELTDHTASPGALAVAARALLTASESFNQLIVGRPWTDELTKIGTRLVDLVKASGLR